MKNTESLLNNRCIGSDTLVLDVRAGLKHIEIIGMAPLSELNLERPKGQNTTRSRFRKEAVF